MGKFDWVTKIFGDGGETDIQVRHLTANTVSFADSNVIRDLEERFERTGPRLKAEAKQWELKKTQSLTNCEFPYCHLPQIRLT